MASEEMRRIRLLERDQIVVTAARCLNCSNGNLDELTVYLNLFDRTDPTFTARCMNQQACQERIDARGG